MQKINAYIGFNGKCREAMEWYQQCFGGELSIVTFAESPLAEQMPAESQNDVVHSCLSNGNMVLMGSDMTGPHGFVPGNTVSLMISCESEDEINKLFSQLSTDGEVTCPLGEQFWGDTFAAVVDKFGTCWLLNLSKNPQA
jgi:PhnB protein